MKIIVVGTGYVGLVHAAVCSEYGHEVYAYDNDLEKVNAFSTGKAENIESYVNEPGLSNIIRETLGRYLFFSTDFESIAEGSDVIFLCLPTPPNLDGSTDLSIYNAAAELMAQILVRRRDKRRVVIVNKSTVPIGTVRHLQKILSQHKVPNFGIASNPEFLAEGTAVDQARRPDRVVVGCDYEEDFKNLRRLYSQFVNHVRISTWGSFVSNGAGGSCFGKDIRSLIYQLRRLDVDTKMLEASYEVNEYQKIYLVERAITEAGFEFNNKTVAVLGLAFKKQTNDMRDASSIRVIESLLGKGVVKIKAYDPLAIEAAKSVFSPLKNILFEKIVYCQTPKEALEGSHAVFISSDCDEFRGLSGTIENVVNFPYLIIDGRRMIPDYQELINKGYDYLAVGASFIRGNAKGEERPHLKVL